MKALRGHTGSSISHAQSGINLLAEQSNGSSKLPRSTIPFTSLSRLEVFFNRVDASLIAMLGKRPMDLCKGSPPSPPGFHSTIPPAFTSLEEARYSLDYHWNRCIHETDSTHPVTDQELEQLFRNRPHYERIFQDWQIAFQAFLSHHPNPSYHQVQSARMLQIIHTISIISLRCATNNGSLPETSFDTCVPLYARIVSLARDLTSAQLAVEGSEGMKTPRFSLEMNIIAPLYAVAHRCRDPRLRREAVAIMRACHRREGVWDSLQAAMVAETVIHIEVCTFSSVKTSQKYQKCDEACA